MTGQVGGHETGTPFSLQEVRPSASLWEGFSPKLLPSFVTTLAAGCGPGKSSVDS